MRSTPQPDSYGRLPESIPALRGIEVLTDETRQDVLDVKKIGKLAVRYGLDSVVRWMPKNADNLEGSGKAVIMGQALYAIVGAIALQKGGKVANEVAHRRILDRSIIR